MDAKLKENLEEKFRLIKNGEVRTRFAPSPTGFLHIGSCRTALFNFLFSRKHRGRVILRIEDTDKERSKVEFENDILNNLQWLGINWDEGPIATGQDQTTNFKKDQEYIGSYGPYKQSERINIYKKYLKKLLEEKRAYYCFCSEEEIEQMKQEQISRGLPPRYNGKCAGLSLEEVKRRLDKKQPAVIRFKVPEKKVSFIDMIRGKIEFDAALFGDIVIAKGLEEPLYNFAAVIDDFEMKITHVIRGEDHLSNTPKQILLQEALGFNSPIYGHLPLILGPDKRKLSKRHGSMSVEEYKKMGYLPEAIINFLAFLGWNPGTKREVFSLSSLIQDFSVEKIQKSGAIFNIKRLDYLNGFYIRQKSLQKLTELCLPYLIEKGLIRPIIKLEQYPPAYGGRTPSQIFEIVETKEEIGFEYLEKIVALYQERLKKIAEISELSDFFFQRELKYPKNLLLWKNASEEETRQSLDKLSKILSKIRTNEWNREKIAAALTANQKDEAGDRGKLLWPLRVALTGKKFSAGPFEIAEILGKEKTLKRIEKAKE